MNVRETVVERLAADTTVSGMVGTRIRPVQASQDDVFPYLVFERTAGQKYLNLEGVAFGETATFAIYCLADTDTVCQALADAARASMIDPTWGGSSDQTIILLCVVEEEVSDGQETPINAKPLAPYRADLSFTLTF